MKLFEPNLNSTNYAPPIIKLSICVIVILICMFRKTIFNCDIKPLSTIISVISFVLTIVCVIVAYISCCEIYATFENIHENDVEDSQTFELIHIDDILSQIDNNDIIEYQILTNNGLIMVGSSSDNRYGSSKFFDKKFYCDKQEFDSLDELKNELLKISIDSQLKVISIDGNAVGSSIRSYKNKK